jgi:hypothetical protein
MTMDPYSWGGGGNFMFNTISFSAIGDGAGGPGSLLLGNMLLDWNGTYYIPISVVWDASGFFSELGTGLAVGQVLAGGATPASENGDGAFPGGAVVATTTWNTTTIGGGTIGTNPSGTLPLIADTVGGSTMTSGPFAGANFNFDIRELTIASCADTGTGTNACAAPVPIPAAVWLFGSGLVGLVGVAGRRNARGRNSAIS